MLRPSLLLVALAACTDKADDSQPIEVDCSTRELVVPSARGEVTGVWDAARQRLVVFGGDEGMPDNCIPQPEFLDQTWAFNTDCNNFEQITGAGPSARTRQATALDAGRNRMLIHGGRWRDGSSGPYDLLTDLWALDLTTDTWARLSEDDGPAARVNHGMVVAGDKLVVFGGNTSRSGTAYTPRDDVWTYDLAGSGGWDEVDAGAGPEARLFHAMAGNAAGTRLYVYAGGDENAFFGGFFSDLWELDTTTWAWTLLDSGEDRGDPALRIGANLMVDDANNRLVMWSGHNDRGLAAPTNEVWVYDLGGGGWQELEEGDTYNRDAFGFCDYPPDFADVDVLAPERRYMGAAALTDGGELIIFGGKTDCGQINDVWSYDFSSNAWTERSAATFGEVCMRAFSGDCESLCM